MGKKERTLPPGSMGWPIIGETLSFIKDPQNFAQKRFEQYGDVFKTYLFGQRVIYVKGAEANRFFLTSKKVEATFPSSTKVLLGSSISNQLGETHKSRRQILAQCFKPRALEKYFQTMVKITESYFQKWEKLSNLTWYPEIQNYTFDVAANFLLGVSEFPAMRELFENYEQGLFSFYPFPLPFTKYGRALKSRQQLLAEIDKIIQKKRQLGHIGSDALSILIEAKDEEGKRLSLDELKNQVLTLWFAGHSTLTSALVSFGFLMAKHPEVLSRVRKEQNQLSEPLTKEQLSQMPYLEQVIQEVLRLNPPVAGSFRKVLAECDFEGYRIPEGWNILYQIRESHRDVEVYSEPEKFEPERFSPDNKTKPYSYIPFGGGVRECLGKEFAKLEMKIFTALLVRGYSWELLPAQDLDFELIPVLRPKDDLKVNFKSL